MSDMDFPPPPYLGDIDAYTRWVHEVVDGGIGEPREIERLQFNDLSGEVTGVRLTDKTCIDVREGVVYDGEEVLNFEERWAELEERGIATHRLNGVEFHVITGPTATEEDRRELIAEHAPEPRPIGGDLGL